MQTMGQSLLRLLHIDVTERRDRWTVLALLLLLLCLPLAGCSDDGQALADDSSSEASEEEKAEDGEEEEEDEEELVPVEVVALARGPIEAVLRFSTNLEAESEVQVFSQAARQVTELLVEEGDQVAKGQVLVRLQDDEQKAELARIRSQQKKAQREYDRQQNLFSKELISEQTMNEATYEVEQLEIALEDARRNLGYTEVRAPIAGTLTGRHVNLGDHITVNQHLFDLVDFDTIVARVYVPEKEMARLSKGQTARLFSASMGEGTRSGEVVRIAPIVDARSGTVKATVGIPRHQGLLPGMYVEVELVTDTHPDALLVPKRAVVYDNDQGFVFRLSEEMKVERLVLVAQLEDSENIEPRAGLLAAGDRIVVAGQAGLKSGAKVRLAGQKAEDDEPAAAEEVAP